VVCGGRFHEGASGQREQFVAAVADDDMGGRTTVEAAEFIAETLGGGLGIEAEATVDGGADGFEHGGGGRVRVFVGIELDEAGDGGLFAGHVCGEALDQGADEALV